MKDECDICGEKNRDCLCAKHEKHKAIVDRRRKIIREKLSKLFKTELNIMEEDDSLNAN